MQRRRRRKAEPKNIFGTSASSTQSSSPTKARRENTQRIRPQAAPPSVPGAKPKPMPRKRDVVKTKPKNDPIKSKTSSVKVVDESKVAQTKNSEELIVNNLETIDEQQSVEKNTVSSKEIIPDKKSRKDLGLETKPIERLIEKNQTQGTSQKARQIIQDSLIKASQSIQKISKVDVGSEKAAGTKPTEKQKPPQKKFRSRVSSYQPASRAKRLDRSRHMEYKYEMRGLLQKISVAEEHRSNILATIWARGERQTSSEAKEFIHEKLSEGIIDEKQTESLEKIVDQYTIRR